MLLAFIDEASPEANSAGHSESRFFVVGTTVIEATRAHSFSQAVEKIRDESGFDRGDALKYSFYDKPPRLSKAAHTEAKKAVLEAAADHDVKVILYCALHKVIDSHGMNTYLNRAIDSKLTKIQQLSKEHFNSSPFICFFDRHSRDDYSKHLISKFCDRSNQTREEFNTPGLVAVASVWDGTSHLASLCDIITGSFNYVINNPSRDIAGRELMKSLKPLLWSDAWFQIYDRGLLFRPNIKSIRHQPYKDMYIEARNRITRLTDS